MLELILRLMNGIKNEGSIWLSVKGLVTTAFMVNPQHLFAVLALFAIDMAFGYRDARRRHVPFDWQAYRLASTVRIVHMGVWLAAVLLITNMADFLTPYQPYFMVATALYFFRRIAVYHLSSDFREVFIAVEGAILRQVTKTVTKEGKNKVIDHHIVTERPATETHKLGQPEDSPQDEER